MSELLTVICNFISAQTRLRISLTTDSVVRGIMQRRQFLTLSPFVLTGCLGDRPPVNGGGSPSPTPPSDEIQVSIVSRADHPAIPVEYTVDVEEPTATTEQTVRTSGVAGDSDSIPDGAGATEFEWGFTLRIGN